jgi:hypothetical protein
MVDSGETSETYNSYNPTQYIMVNLGETSVPYTLYISTQYIMVNLVKMSMPYSRHNSNKYIMVNLVEISVPYIPHNPTHLHFSPLLLLVHSLDTSFYIIIFFIFHNYAILNQYDFSHFFILKN